MMRLAQTKTRHPEVAAQRPSKGDDTDLGFTRDRQFKLRKSATADLRGRASFEARKRAHLRMTVIVRS